MEKIQYNTSSLLLPDIFLTLLQIDNWVEKNTNYRPLVTLTDPWLECGKISNTSTCV